MDVKKLLSKLTLEEKIYQLMQIRAYTYLYDSSLNIITGPDTKYGVDEKYVYEVGTVLNCGVAENMIKIQEKYLENSKNKIPLIFMQDVIHGYRTLYPINLGIAASFDTDLAEKCAAMAAKEASVDGIHLTFAPMVDLARDARWGRVMESSGEDTYLNCKMAEATVRGYQGDFGKYNVASCVKHFAAYGAAEGGRDYNTVDMSERTLREYYLPSYKAAIDAGASSLMTAFNVVDGIPAAGNKWLVKDLLRDEWGFNGVVISDYAACYEMINHGFCEDEKEVAYNAINATLDIEMVSNCYVLKLKELVEEGKVKESQIDECVLRILELKDKLGLFDNPHRSTSPEEAAKFHVCPEHRALARYAATQSAVLLKNEGVLPLSRDLKSIAVIGPLANTGEIFGNWFCNGRADETVSVLDGIKNAYKGVINYAEGCSVSRKSTDEGGIPEAVDMARKSDAVILCLGEHQFDNGECKSKAFLDLPNIQYKLYREVLKANPNTAVVLFTGRPLTIRELKDTSPAILNMWEPGTEGGNACADLIFGDVNPSGKLTMSFPYTVGQCPLYYNYYTTGRPKVSDDIENAYVTSYIDSPNGPLYPFGYGLSYTEFEYSDFNLSGDVMERGGKLTASVKVKNVGKYKGKETVQMYIRDLFGSTVRPIKELRGYEKIELMPNEEKTVTFEITEDTLAFYGSDLVKKAESGKFHVFIGKSSACEHFAEFILK